MSITPLAAALAARPVPPRTPTKDYADVWLPVTLGLGWKLALAPLVMLGIGGALGMHGLLLTITVLQAAMAPMISAAILADQHDLEPDLANAILGIGILLSLLTVPLWNLLLS